MFIKQIDLKEALRLACKGHEVKVLLPSSPKNSWEDYVPDTLQNVLDGCLFFRQEPAMDNSKFAEATKKLVPVPCQPPDVDSPADEAAAATASSAEKPTGKCAGTAVGRKKVDVGKILALRKAGWSMEKIGEEMGVSGVTIGKYLKKLAGEQDEKD